MKSTSRWNLQVGELLLNLQVVETEKGSGWLKMTNLKKEVGQNDRFTHLQHIFTHLHQKWNKFTHIFISRQIPPLLIPFLPT